MTTRLFVNVKHLICSFIIFSFYSHALQFNQDKIINLGSKGDELNTGEGYLFISFETGYSFSRIIIKPVDSGKKMTFKEIHSGKNYALIKLKAGKYFLYYMRSESLNLRSAFKFPEERFPIEVKPGVVNYPGSWKFSVNDYFNNRYYINFNITNKSSSEFEVFNDEFSHLAPHTKFVYQAKFKDPFLDFYRNSFQTSNEGYSFSNYMSDSSALSNFSTFNPKNGLSEELEKFPLIKKYLQADAHSVKSMNPNGNLVLATMVEDNIFTIAVLNLNTYKSFSLLSQELPKFSHISDVSWIDNNSIFYRFGNNGIYTNHIAHLKINASGQIKKVEILNLPTNGFLINSLINEKDKILFYKKSNYYKKFGIFKVNVSSKNSITFSLKKRYSRKKLFNEAFYWLSDINGNLRFTVTSEYDKKSEERNILYWFRPNPNKNDWQLIKTINSDEDYFFPKYLSKDEKYFYVVSDEKTDKNAILAYSTSDFSFKKIVFEDPLVNVESILTDPSTNEFNGFNYIDKGIFKSRYLNSDSDYLKDAKASNPKLNLYSVQFNKQASKILIYGTKLDSEGAWYVYDIKSESFIKLIEANPEYEKLTKGISSQISVKSTDGLDIEGYLVQPKKSNQLTPLIVIPHGGPIGVRDYAHNDSVQQFLAYKGFASLKVNYRGSEGYGKTFKNKGNQQWGKKIEEDINAMVSHVVANYSIDNTKICAMGASYGGYSAIMLSILYPERYICAISLAGVTDLSLKFSSNNWYKNEKTLKKLKEIIGDPVVNILQLRDNSPVYNFDKITKPILLFQGLDDNNVTAEHALRLYKLTQKAHKDVKLIMLKGEGHSFKNIESLMYYLIKSIEFLNKNFDVSSNQI